MENLSQRDVRLAVAGKALPQIDTALRMGMDRAVLDKMLFNCMDAAPLGPNGSKDLKEAFGRFERMHGGFASLFRVTEAQMQRDQVYLDVKRAQALYTDLQEMAVIHFQPNVRQLCRQDPEAAEAVANLGDLLASLRVRMDASRALQQDAGLVRAVENLNETVYAQEAETQAALRRMPGMRVA